VTDDRRYPQRPIVGVGALIFHRGRILMAQRGKEPLKGWWSLPGGALEVGESLDCAVRREVREETGLEIEPLSVFEIFERIMRDEAGAPEYHYVLIDYVCRVTGGTLCAGDDVSRFPILGDALTQIERALLPGKGGHGLEDGRPVAGEDGTGGFHDFGLGQRELASDNAIQRVAPLMPITPARRSARSARNGRRRPPGRRRAIAHFDKANGS